MAPLPPLARMQARELVSYTNGFTQDMILAGDFNEQAGNPPMTTMTAAFYAVHHTTPYIRQVDVHGGYTAAAGHALYTARAYPKAFWNRTAFVCEPTGLMVGMRHRGVMAIELEGGLLVIHAMKLRPKYREAFWQVMESQRR